MRTATYNRTHSAEGMAQVICPHCDGDGFDHRLAFNIRTRLYEEVNELTWILLPVTEEDAEAKNWNYCRAEEHCPHCNGLGLVLQDENGECYPIP